jgi:hypothetical protein
LRHRLHASQIQHSRGPRGADNIFDEMTTILDH